jgi:serine/threonine protein kinase
MMRTGSASVASIREPHQVDEVVRRYLQECRHGQPDLEAHLGAPKEEASVSLLVALVKAELRDRTARGMEPNVAEYLVRFPQLSEHNSRVISLVYEEYCLREEAGDAPDVEEFCERYEPWKDSLASQLRYHRALSQVAGTAPRTPRYPKPGTLFEKFRLRSELGRGGSARVFLAEQTDLGNRLVALKVSVDRGSEPAILGRLVHDHIIPVLTSAVEPESELRGLCMPYRAGLPLDQVIRLVDPASSPSSARVLRDVLASVKPAAGEEDASSRGHGWLGFPENGSYADGVAWVGLELAEALAYAHDQDVLHLDVKPANVLLTATGGPQLLDFNLSHDPHAATEAVAALRGGTLPYMAPEQLDAFLDKDHWDAVGNRADVYSLGLLLREMLTGQPPSAHDPEIPLPRAIGQLLDSRRDLRSDLRQINPRLPHGLDAIIGKCIQFDPSDRYASATALAEDLRRFLERKPLCHAINPSARERTENWFRRHGRVLAVTTAVILGICGIGLGSSALQGPRENLQLREAFIEFKAGHFADAAHLFRQVALQSNSAVANFYLAASLLEMDRLEEGVPLLTKILGAAASQKDLEEWGRTHPALVRDAESLAEKLLRLKLDHADRKEALYSLADSVEKFSHTINNKSSVDNRSAVDNKSAVDNSGLVDGKALALLEESRGEFESAATTIGRLIDGIGSLRNDENRKNLLSYSLLHARIELKEAQKLLDRAPEDAPASLDLDQAEACVRRSVEDLHRIDPSDVTTDEQTLFSAKYFEILTAHVAGKIADRRDQHQAALDYYRDAIKIADEAINSPHWTSDKAYLIQLRESVSGSMDEAVRHASRCPGVGVGVSAEGRETCSDTTDAREPSR